MGELTQDLLKELFDYRDGELYWKKSGKGRKMGVPAGSIAGDGYQQIAINDKSYYTHRLIFLFYHGYLPEFLDHIDGNRSNNSIDNLREATNQENLWNQGKTKSHNGKPTSSIYKGVSWHKASGKWMSYIYIDGKQKYLGRYDSGFNAALAYDRAATKYFGNFAKMNGK